MWDRPGLMMAAANTLFALAAVIVAGAILLRASQAPAFQLREIRVTGDLRHVTRGEIEAVAGRLRGSFFTLNLAAARAAFEQLAWVRSVAVRRQWPAGLDVALEEHQPLARWLGPSGPPPAAKPGALVNTHGEVFEAAYEGSLPVFAGPQDAAREISIQYRYFLRTLAAIGDRPVEVQLSARRAWQLKLESGLTLALGRENVESRLERFATSRDRAFGALGRRVDYVDLRYPNGFAVRIPELRRERPGRRGRRAG